MEVQAGLKGPNRPDITCKFLRDSPRQWYARMHLGLKNELYINSCAYEFCLYIKHPLDCNILISLYTDGLLISGNNLFEM